MAFILLVEDDAVTSTILARMVEQAGHQVEIAKNGLAAIELLEAQDFAVLVTDMMMPRLGGQELCEQVRTGERNRDIPILVTTGMIDAERLAWVEMFDGVEVFSKPVDVTKLVERIDALSTP